MGYNIKNATDAAKALYERITKEKWEKTYLAPIEKVLYESDDIEFDYRNKYITFKVVFEKSVVSDEIIYWLKEKLKEKGFNNVYISNISSASEPFKYEINMYFDAAYSNYIKMLWKEENKEN